ncbi:MAG: alpha/beta hydrolase fold domain-containing protein [Planctomycetota bacterium]
MNLIETPSRLRILFMPGWLTLAVTMVLFSSGSLTVAQETKPDADAKTNKVETQVNNWMRGDKNGDGKLAKSELRQWQRKFFQPNDKNKDGFLDRPELTALAKRWTQGGNQNRSRQPMSTKDLQKLVPEQIKLIPDVVYREGDDLCQIDLYMPAADAESARPVILVVHGGGWQNGDKRQKGFVDTALGFAKQGYVCASVNYRLAPKVSIKEIVGDVKCSVRYLRAHSDQYNIDVNCFGAYGNSAGAHLVCMLGLCKPEAEMEGDGPWKEQSSMVQAVCASATPTSFMVPINERMRGMMEAEKAKAQVADKGKERDAGTSTGSADRPKAPHRQSQAERESISPIHYAAADAPPILLFHDESDTTVSAEQSKIFVAALKKAGAKDITFKLYDNKSGHGVFNKNFKETGPMRAAFFERTLKTVAKSVER